MSAANLEEANLQGANLSGANLSKAVLTNAILNESNLSNAILASTNLSATRLVSADLTGTTLVETNFHSANLSQANLQGVDATSANFELAYLKDTNLTDAKIDNKWRLVREVVTVSEINRDLSGRDLSNADLSQAQLQGANLREANLHGTNLSGANLNQAAFHDARVDATTVIDEKWAVVWEIVTHGAEERDVSGRDLSNANLTGANLKDAHLQNTNLENANLAGADLAGAVLDGAVLRNVQVNSDTDLDEKWRLVSDLLSKGGVGRDLQGADLSRAFLEGVDFSGANLQEANLQGSNLKEANLSSANLTQTELRGANLEEANLDYAVLIATQMDDATTIVDKWRHVRDIMSGDAADIELQGIDLSQAYLRYVDFSEMNLGEANLSGADLEYAELRAANLTRANLSNTDLWHADLTDAILDYANLRNARVHDRATMIPDKWWFVWDIVTNGGADRDLDGLDFARADLAGADLSDCVFTNSTLANANLERANLSGSDLRQADLTGTSLRWVNLHDVQMDDTTQIADKWREVWNIVNQVEERDNLNDVDLSYTDLTKLDLSGQSLIQANLTYAILRDTSIIGANVSAADFSLADLRGTRLNDATVIDAKWRLVWQIVNHNTGDSMNFSGVDLSRAFLSEVDMSGFNLTAAECGGCDLSDSNLSEAVLKNANLSGANLSHANLRDADLRDAILQGANLRGTDLSGASIMGALVTGANLDSAEFGPDSDIEKVELISEIKNSGAIGKDLSDKDLSQEELPGIDFIDANLRNTNLTSTNLRECNFTKAVLADADLVEADLSHTTFISTDLSRADLRNATFTNADLQDANLTNADMTGAILDKANLQGALVEEEQWRRAKSFKGLILPDGSVYRPWFYPVIWTFLITTVVIVGFSVRHYPTYATVWGENGGSSLSKLTLLALPPVADLNVNKLTITLRQMGAFCTPSEVQEALRSLQARGVVKKEDNSYSHRTPPVAWLHYILKSKYIPDLAKQIREKHPLYYRSIELFKTMRLQLREIDMDTFLLHAEPPHPLTQHSPIYVRFIAGRAPRGEDFTSVCEDVRKHFNTDKLSYRVALVISDRRPEPGARYRLYEIREREGLDIVPLDLSIFDQIKPNRTAIEILQSEIDQATGQQNLYAISTPVSSDLSFFGREHVLQEIANLLNSGQPVGLFGLRKAGKTSLIQRLQGQLAQQRPIALVDPQSKPRKHGVWSLYLDIIAAFVRHLQRYQPQVMLPDLQLWPNPNVSANRIADAYIQDLHTLHMALGRPDSRERLLLIVDEIDRLLPDDRVSNSNRYTTFFGQLRAANQQAHMLDFLVVGVDATVNRVERWRDQDNELYRSLREVWMPPMAPSDVQEMIDSLGSHMGVRYEPDALNWLSQCGGGHPFVTRQICSRAVEGKLNRGAMTVTLEQAHMALDDFIFQDSYLREMWRTRLDDRQREMLRALAKDSESLPRLRLLPTSQRQETLAALNALENYTLVKRENSDYAIAWDVFRKWIRWVELGLEE